jgi:hypothetical protein
MKTTGLLIQRTARLNPVVDDESDCDTRRSRGHDDDRPHNGGANVSHEMNSSELRGADCARDIRD